jgi:hypothetical protein
MIISAEIASVAQIPVKPWEGPKGNVWFIEGTFTDGSLFSRGATSIENAQKLHSQLTDLVGKPESFDVKDSNREYQGKKKWNLQAVPGQEAYGGAGRQGSYGFRGGSSQGRPATQSRDSYRYSEQGTKEERDSIVRQVALKCAVDTGIACKAKGTPEFLTLADQFYTWLTQQPKPAEIPAYERYSNSIAEAVKAKDSARLDTLMKMIKGSLAKGTLNMDQVAALDDELVAGKKAVNSAASMEEWYKRKQEQAHRLEPVHESSAMADTILQSEEVF